MTKNCIFRMWYFGNQSQFYNFDLRFTFSARKFFANIGLCNRIERFYGRRTFRLFLFLLCESLFWFRFLCVLFSILYGLVVMLFHWLSVSGFIVLFLYLTSIIVASIFLMSNEFFVDNQSFFATRLNLRLNLCRLRLSRKFSSLCIPSYNLYRLLRFLLFRPL